MDINMKKVLTFCLAMVMTVSMCISTLAAPGGFMSSPSGKPAPIVVSITSANKDCTAKLVITPYGERATLSDALRALLEKAYSEIVGIDDVTKLNADLAKLVADKNLDSSKIAVDQLFDIHVTGCDTHEGHTDFDIVLDAEMLSRFVGLLHMNKDGVWELVADAEVVNNGEHLKFSIDSFSPFAIVINTGEVEDPDTGDSNAIYLYAGLMAVSAVALAFLVFKSKKQRA